VTVPKRLHSERLGSFVVFDVWRHRVRMLSDVELDVFTLDMADWVTVVAVTAARRVVLIEQPRFGANAMMLETPGGIVDGEEQPPQAGARELREETGYVADRWRSLGWVHPNPAIQGNRIHLMLAEGAELRAPRDLDEHEQIDVHLFEPSDLRAMLDGGKIRHALSALALERALAQQL
jgi:ADP-ribose pyrophosphatase